MKIKLTYIFLLCLLSNFVMAQNEVEIIKAAFNDKQVEQLSPLFNSNVELILFSNNKVYTKNQAKMVLKDFFSKNPIQSFNMVHTIEKKNSYYILGKIQSNKTELQIQLILKKKNDRYFIHLIHINNDN